LSGRDLWRDWTRDLQSQLGHVREPEHAVAGIANRIRRDLGGTFSASSWKQAGVRLSFGELETSGACAWVGVRPTILLRRHESETSRRHRFTAAHEIGHLLLARTDVARRFTLDWYAEERLCNLFATSLLIPPEELEEALGNAGANLSPWDVVQVANMLRVNLQPAVVSLGRWQSDREVVYLLARLRGHPNRPDAVDYRIETAAGDRRVFLPRHQRLRSLGLAELSEWASSAPIAEGRSGADQDVRLRLSSGGRFVAAGPVPWQAVRLGAESSSLVLATLDTSALRFRRDIRRRQTYARGRSLLVGAQMTLWERG
jgi:hypothetical protein